MCSFSMAVFRAIVSKKASRKYPPTLLQKHDPSLVQQSIIRLWKLPVKLNKYKFQTSPLFSQVAEEWKKTNKKTQKTKPNSSVELTNNEGVAAGGGPDNHLSVAVCQADEEEGGLIIRELEGSRVICMTDSSI